ncbi:MAG: hypothetical protein IKH46_01920 [Lachnospiraceae bacterium]|nr:hypothetical protein [Lachnospiraceae bacterium]
MGRSPVAVVKAFRILLIMITVCSFGIWLFLPNNKPVNLTDLTKKEIVELANGDTLVGHGFFRLPEESYRVIDCFYTDSIVVSSVKHYEQRTYKFFNILFRDVNGESVVIAAKSDIAVLDPEENAGEIVGKMNFMSDQMQNRQLESYKDENMLDGVLFYQTMDLEGVLKSIGAKVCIASAILAAGVSWLLRRVEEPDGIYEDIE